MGTTSESSLFVAIVAALRQVAEVKEAEFHRFFDLVGVGAGEEHH
jgi:hypothetical protein